MMHTALRVSLAIAVSCFGLSAAHAERRVAQLTYSVAPTASCPDSATFAQRVAARTGYESFDPGADLRVRIRVEVTAAGLRGRFVLANKAATISERTLDAATDECDQLVSALALTAAMKLDPADKRPEPVVRSARVARREQRPDDRVVLRVLANLPNLGVHVFSESATATGFGMSLNGGGAFIAQATSRSYKHLCVAPCSVRMPPGAYRLAMSLPDGTPVEASSPVRFDQDTELRASYVSNRGTRVLGWLTAIGGGLIGTGMAVAGIGLGAQDDCAFGECKSRNKGLITAGTIVTVASLVVGMLMVRTGDEVRFTPSSY